MNIKSWNWKKIFFNAVIIFFGLYFSSILGANLIAVSLVYCGMAISLVLFNKD